MNPITSRRHFLKAAAAVSMGFGGLHTLVGCGRASSAYAQPMEAGYGPVLTDPEGLLNLPQGFSYRILARVGDPLSDGFRVPGKPDGMAAFPAPAGRTFLVCNHELDAGSDSESPFGADFSLADRVPTGASYDRRRSGRPCPGGTSTLLYDTASGRVERHHLSLTGTLRNCAGGPTPWGSWITCEETVQRADDNEFTRDHGFNFEVPADHPGLIANPQPLTAMGRFNHEAIAVHPASGIVYQTEDRGDGLIYRYLPNRPGNLAAGGRLQVLAVRDQPSFDMRNWDDPNAIPAGARFAVDWIDAQDILSPDDDLRLRMFDRGAARFARGEGMWFGNDAIYFACTNGGAAKKGQVWRYVPSSVEGQPGEASSPGSLELFLEPNDAKLLENCDNLTVAPWGDIVMAEDSGGENRLIGVTPRGDLYIIASQTAGTEFAGCTFSPDGSTLFANMQHIGITLAITGPWRAV